MPHPGIFTAMMLIMVPAAPANDIDRPSLAFTVSQANVFDGFDDSFRHGIEYRFEPLSTFKLVPVAGITTAANGATFVYADMRRHFVIARNWTASASFGVGRYDPDDLIDLGNLLEFRSGAMVAYHTDQYALELAMFHFSNGGIGHTNPGTEALVLSFVMPLTN